MESFILEHVQLNYYDRDELATLKDISVRFPEHGVVGMIRRKMVCSRKRIYRLMRQLHIQSARKFAYKRTTNSRHSHPVAPNLLNRNFQVSKPNTVWVGDITYIPTGQGWHYQGRHHAKQA